MLVNGINNRMSKKLKHLEFIQATIARMSQKSFLIKGWSVTLSVAVLALDAISWWAVIPLLFLWWLDASYFQSEKAYRELYRKVSTQQESDIDFDMEATEYKEGTCKLLLNKTLFTFYIALFLIVIIFSGIK